MLEVSHRFPFQVVYVAAIAFIKQIRAPSVTVQRECVGGDGLGIGKTGFLPSEATPLIHRGSPRISNAKLYGRCQRRQISADVRSRKMAALAGCRDYRKQF